MEALQTAIKGTWRQDRYLRAIHDDGTEIGVEPLRPPTLPRRGRAAERPIGRTETTVPRGRTARTAAEETSLVWAVVADYSMSLCQRGAIRLATHDMQEDRIMASAVTDGRHPPLAQGLTT